MDRLTRATLGAGMAILMLAIVLIVSEATDGEVISIVVAVASGLLFFSIFRAYLVRKGEIYKDERTQKIHNSALAISWWAAYVVLAAVYLLSLGKVFEMDLSDFVPLMFFLMLATYWTAKTYLSHRGEPR
ncbi:MAG: hypothetical protein SA339_01285 [Methanomassiliicoccus sp.]|nr:hypothetical protein [Methanomassiliicoccus sp.]